MEYQIRLTWNIFGQIIFLPLLVSALLFKAFINHDYYWLAIWLTLGFLLIFKWIRLTFAFILGKNILIVTDEYIRDNYNKITYYWKDIEFGEASGQVLQLKLYDPYSYIGKYENALQRFKVNLFYKLFRKLPRYAIDLSIIAYEKELESVVNNINDYSIRSEEKN